MKPGSHTHQAVSDPFVATALAGRPVDHCEVIDAHGHVGPGFTFPFVDSSLERHVASMDRMGIVLTAVSGLPACFGDARRGNQMVAEAVARFPARFFGYMAVDAGYPKTILPELERGLQAGLRGVKLHSLGRTEIPYNHPNYQLAYAFADAHRLPVLAHTWDQELDWIEPMVGRYPNINWILAHACYERKQQYFRMAREYPSVYLESCLSSCPRGLYEEFAAEGLADKVLWGSDAIFMDAAQQLGRVLFAQIAPEEKVKFLGLNARRALRL